MLNSRHTKTTSFPRRRESVFNNNKLLNKIGFLNPKLDSRLRGSDDYFKVIRYRLNLKKSQPKSKILFYVKHAKHALVSCIKKGFQTAV